MSCTDITNMATLEDSEEAQSKKRVRGGKEVPKMGQGSGVVSLAVVSREVSPVVKENLRVIRGS